MAVAVVGMPVLLFTTNGPKTGVPPLSAVSR